MSIRLFLILLIVLIFPGMFLHYVGEECDHDENCPICQQAQGSPAEIGHACFDVPVIAVQSLCASCAELTPASIISSRPQGPRAPPAGF